MTRLSLPLGLACGLLLPTGCPAGGPEQTLETGSSEGPSVDTTSSSGTSSGTTDDPSGATTQGPSNEESTGSSSSSGGEPPEEPVETRVSVLVLDDLDVLEPPGHDELFRIDYVDGVVAAPVRVSAPSEHRVFQPILTDSGQHLFFARFVDEGNYVYVPLEDGEPGIEVPLSSPLGSTQGDYGFPVVTADENAVFFEREDTRTIFKSELGDHLELGVQEPAVVFASPAYVHEFDVAPDGTWAFIETSDSESRQLWAVPAAEPDPTAATLVSEFSMDTDLIARPTFSPSMQGAYYTARADTYEPTDLYYVGLAEGSASTAVRVHAPLLEDDDIGGAKFSPDGAVLAYAVSSPYGDALYTVEVDGPTLSLPQQHTLPEGADYNAQDLTWSPDGRWLIVRARTPGYAADLYALDMSQGGSVEAVLLTEPEALPGSAAMPPVFAGSDKIYYTDSFHEDERRVFGIDLSGAVPTQPEVVSGDAPNTQRVGFFALSHDESYMLFDSRDAVQIGWETGAIYKVDLIEGAIPAEVARPEWGLVARANDVVISENDRAFVYREASANPDSTDPALLRVIDLATPGQAVTVAEAPTFYWVLTPS